MPTRPSTTIRMYRSSCRISTTKLPQLMCLPIPALSVCLHRCPRESSARSDQAFSTSGQMLQLILASYFPKSTLDLRPHPQPPLPPPHNHPPRHLPSTSVLFMTGIHPLLPLAHPSLALTLYHRTELVDRLLA